MNVKIVTAFLLLSIAFSEVLSEVQTYDYYYCYKCRGNGYCAKVVAYASHLAEKCTSTTAGCYTIKRKNETIRGCANNTADLIRLTQGGELQGPCRWTLCNNEYRPEKYYTCYYCNDQNKCKNPTRENGVGTQICTSRDQGCVTIRDSSKTLRGCFANKTDVDFYKRRGDLFKICLGNNCNSERTYNCYRCQDNGTCKDLSQPELVKKEVCSMSSLGCATFRMYNGEVLRSCIQNDQVMAAYSSLGELVERCNWPDLCNDKPYEGELFWCHKCAYSAYCNEPSRLNTSSKESCDSVTQGYCYTLLKKNKVLRGCGSFSYIELLKGEGTLLDNCQGSFCNMQRIFDCYSCNRSAECLNPILKKNVNTEKCIAEKNEGCYSLQTKNGVVRGCAKDKNEMEELKKIGNLHEICFASACNRDKLSTLKGSGTIFIPHFIFAILPVIGALIFQF